MVVYMHLTSTMTDKSITVLSDTTSFANDWNNALSAVGLRTQQCNADELAQAINDSAAVVVDASLFGHDDDELLATVGFIRACGRTVAVGFTNGDARIEDVVDEICDGLVATKGQDVLRIADRIARRVDEARATRFEFVTVSPDANALLAVMANGKAVLHPRPIASNDDLSAVVEIRLSDDAKNASITLESGAQCTLSTSAPQSNGASTLWTNSSR